MKVLICHIAVVVLMAIFVGTAVLGADSGQVAATVTASVIAVTVSDGGVAYGTVATSEDTTSSGVNDTQTITNTGTVNEAFEIKGVDTTHWTLAGAAGDATYAHKTCIADCDTTPSWTAMTTSYTDLDTGKTPSATTALDLQITVPTANAGTAQETANVDILATAS